MASRHLVINLTQMLWLYWKFPKLFSFIITILIILTQTSAMANFLTMDPDDQITNSDLPDISHALALKLCRSMNQTRVPHLNRYLWTRIVLSDMEDTTDDHLSVKPGCFAFRWRKCSYVLPPFFNLKLNLTIRS